MDNTKINTGTIDLGLDDNKGRHYEPKEKKDVEDWDVEDYIQLFDETEYKNNGVVDLEKDDN